MYSRISQQQQQQHAYTQFACHAVSRMPLQLLPWQAGVAMPLDISQVQRYTLLSRSAPLLRALHGTLVAASTPLTGTVNHSFHAY